MVLQSLLTSFGCLPSTPRSADRFLQKHLWEAQLEEPQGVLRRAVVCSVREDVITGVWLFSGGVCSWERVTQ